MILNYFLPTFNHENLVWAVSFQQMVNRNWSVRHVSFTLCILCQLQSFLPAARVSLFSAEIALDCWPLHWPILPWHPDLASGPRACQRSTQWPLRVSPLRASTRTGKFHRSRKNSRLPSSHLCVEPSQITEKWDLAAACAHSPAAGAPDLTVLLARLPENVTQVSQSNRLLSPKIDDCRRNDKDD